MNSKNDVNITNLSSLSSYAKARENDYSKESSNNYSISNPMFLLILRF
jgi:hypothetical protein